MSAPATHLATLPSEFAIFPLAGALLLPHARLPLNIFEPRYCAMVEDALGEGRIFGMIQPDPSRAELPNGPALFAIGSLGRITAFSETDDGRYLITLTGLCRFRLEQELALRRGYRRARAALAPFAQDLRVPEAVELEREPILAALKSYLATRNLGADWKALEALPDERLVGALCMLCPLPPTEKQALLEAPTEAARAETLLTLLRMDAYAQPGGGTEKTPLAS
ncbi:MAG: LON peptidase substrate-binding domain-containing protein [Acetobacteraceae bacterium]